MSGATGFALITVVPTKENLVYRALVKNPKIIELHALFGEYDLIAKVSGESMDDIGRTVIDDIRTIEGVVDTKTLTGTKF